MSELLEVCRSLTKTCADAATYAGALNGQASRLRALAAEVATIVRSGEPGALHAGRAIMSTLEEAARACVACGVHLDETDRRGRAYVTYLVGTDRATGTRQSDPARFDTPPLGQRAGDSEWWPPNDDLEEVFDHVFSGHLTVGNGSPRLSGKHANVPDDTTVIADPTPGVSPDSPARAPNVYLPGCALPPLLDAEDVAKGGFSSLFPPWPRERIESAIRRRGCRQMGRGSFTRAGP
jgi:hypothetical protein